MESGSSYWSSWLTFVDERLQGHGMISPPDTNLFTFTDDPVAAADEICRFYANYHSQRYVDGQLVIRLRHAPTTPQVERLNEEFRRHPQLGPHRGKRATAG